MSQPHLFDLLELRNIKALIFDLDGVITQTARVHANAWKRMFDAYLLQRGQREDKVYEPLSIATDYRRYIDGIPRYDGVRNFLASRGITLPEGTPEDAPGKETVAGLGNLKNTYFQELLQEGGVDVYPDTVAFAGEMRRRGLRTAVISASKNCQSILAAAGLEKLFEVRVDGIVSAELGLKGKPAPDIFLEAVRRLQVKPEQAAVFEDALAGVEAGKAGGFALVVGLDRTSEANELKEHGADVVLQKIPSHTMKNTPQNQVRKKDGITLPSALNQIEALLQGKTPAVFLDYDGCLTPIVKDPDKAILSDSMRHTLRQLAEVCPVAVVSGRDRANVEKLVQLDNLYYAGSHGFDISGPDNMHTEPGGAAAAIPALDKAQTELNERLHQVQGALVERKRYAIAVHYRNVADDQVDDVLKVAQDVLSKYKELKPGPGKKILELKPNLDWHKGKAVHWLLEELELNKPGIIPMYIGDDLTDEDAFAALQGQGISILVGEHDEETAADFRLESVDEVQEFLAALTKYLKK
ncbi:trehalose-phosphatase [Pontibacter anaerobius]|uniref:Trehalose 6-phosphate phosphatase n=1 Tax=Pontibacter anaerobius TaxID=2993940 RepID=A0ABT3RCK1_9BACT|nr:trehalose-phosphatase [Pontibacter anaerobius]MCX2739161.1 trehalose-phosphatase [Pontibacter anaerobius]